MLPRTIEGMKHVCYFRHALALDERRVKFLPEYAYGGRAKPPAQTDDKDETLTESKRLPRQLAHTKEVWFPGTHSDM
jgi:hypothetical protein